MTKGCRKRREIPLCHPAGYTARAWGPVYKSVNDAVVSIEVGQNLVVIKTVTGMAMGVATALDALKWPEILGCIAGDDTIMCACKSSELAEGVMEKLGSILNRK